MRGKKIRRRVEEDLAKNEKKKEQETTKKEKETWERRRSGKERKRDLDNSNYIYIYYINT